jgi:hypothetical protein
MLRCAASFVIAVYAWVRLIPQDLRALPAELFMKPSSLACFFTFLKSSHPDTGRKVFLGNEKASPAGDHL